MRRRASIGLMATFLTISLIPGGTATAQEGAVEARRALPHVVTLRAYDSSGAELGLGSGFVIDGGRIATNSHVVGGASWIEVFSQADEYLGTVHHLEAVSTRFDLAVLPPVGSATASSLKLTTTLPEVGDPVWVIGSPHGLTGTLSSGVVSAIREERGYRLVQLTAPISPGSSGGPVLNRAGEVVGIAVGQLAEGQNLNFAIPTSFLAGLLEAGPGRFDFPSAGVGEPATPTADVRRDETAERLRWEREAREIEIGDAHDGLLEPSDLDFEGYNFDLFKLFASSGDLITIDVRSEDFDTEVVIVLTGDEADWDRDDDDGGAGTNSRLTVTLPEDGLYLIMVFAYSTNSFGRYQLSVTRAAAGHTYRSPGTERDSRWVAVGSSLDGDEWSYDRESVLEVGATRTLWTRISYGEDQHEDGISFDERRVHLTIRCGLRELRIGSSQLLRSGRSVYSDSEESSRWHAITPESMGEALLEAVCD